MNIGSRRVRQAPARWPSSRLPNQALCRYAQSGVQFPDHRHGEFSLAIEHLINPVAPPDHGLQVFRFEPLLIHAELDGLYRIGQINRMVLDLVGFNERKQNFKAVAVGSAGGRFVVEAGIHSISLNPDSIVRTLPKIAETEKKLGILPK